MKILGDTIVDVLHQAAQLRMRRTELLAGNLANVDTPGYQPVDIDFARELRLRLGGSQLRRTDARHLPAPEPRPAPEVRVDAQVQPGLDGNTVSLERQLAKLGGNRLQYEATMAALRKKLAMLRYAVNEGGGA